MDVTQKNQSRRPGRTSNRGSLRVNLSRPLPLPADKLLPWEEELISASLAPPLPVAPVRKAEVDRYAPFGFRTALVDDDSGAIRLVPQPHEAAVVRELFLLYLTERGAQSVALTLSDRGHRMRDGQPWNKTAVLAVLDCPAVAGSEYRVHLPSIDARAMPRYGHVSAPPLIDKSTIELVRRVREDRDPAAAPGRPTNKPQLLKGLLVCARCGDEFQLETSGKTINGTRYRYSYYNCRSATRRRVSVCPGRRMATAGLDQAVLEVLRESVCRDSRFTALSAAQGRLTANPRDTLTKLLTSSETVARIYLLHLVELIEVFEDVIIVTPRTERRFHGKIHWIRPDCA